MTTATARPISVRILLRFPVTTAVLWPYLLVLLPLAVWYDNPETDFIFHTGTLAAAGSLTVESAVLAVALAERASGRRTARAVPVASAARWSGRRVGAVARIVAVVSIVANVGAAALGAGTLQSQVAGTIAGGFAGALTPFSSWGHVALALALAAHFLRGMSRGETLSWIAALLAAQAVSAYLTNITVQLGASAVLVTTLLLMTRLIRPVLTFTGVAAAAAAWPTVFAVRNALRVQNGIAVDTSATAASDRLRFDEQVTRAQDFGAGHDLGQPGIWETIRYGLVPRFLDTERPAISSGNAVNEFLGGTSTSSYTFLPVATTWFFWGALAVSLIYGAVAVVLCALRPWHAIELRPIALVVFVLFVGGPLAMTATPPDSFIKLLQALVSTAPVLLALHLWARRTADAAAIVPVPVVSPVRGARV